MTIPEQLSYALAILLLSILIIMSFSFYFLILNNNFKIQQPEAYERFHQKYDVLWEGLKCRYGLHPNFNVVFISRRFVLAILIIFPFTIEGFPVIF